MGCGSVKTLEHGEKNIKLEENKNQSQFIEEENENISQTKINKNENKKNDIKVEIVEIQNRESTLSSKKLTRKPQEPNYTNENTKTSNVTAKTYRRIEEYATIISAIQEEFPEIEQKIEQKDDIERKYYEFEVKANRYELIYPIWLIKDEEVEFGVEGTWKINPETECDSKGIENKNLVLFPEKINEYLDNNEKKHNDGALVGRVIKGKFFSIYDGLKYTPEESGPLILKMNLNNLWSKEKPEGKLKIKLFGAYKIEDLDDFEKRNGWWNQLKIIEIINEKELQYYEMNNTEKALVVLFNKLRHDSNVFARQYLNNFQNITKTSNQIYNLFINNSLQFTPLKINLTMVKLLQTFFEKIFYKEETKEEDWDYVLSSENCLQEFLIESFYNKKKIHACIVRYYEENIMHICSRILFRKEIRENLLTYEFEEMAIITLFNNWNLFSSDNNNNNLNDKRKNIYYCVFALSNQFGNDHLNYNVDKSFENFIEKEKIKKVLNVNKKIIL